MQATGKETAFDLHQLAVDGTHQGIASLQVEGRGVLLRKVYVLIEVALTCRLDDRVDDLNPAATLTQLLVGPNQLTEFLQALIKTGIFSRRGEVADGGGITPPLGDGGLGGVIGGVVIEVGQRTCLLYTSPSPRDS